MDRRSRSRRQHKRADHGLDGGQYQQIMSKRAVLTTSTGLEIQNPIATFTGKPLSLGGSEGREEATGLGGVFVMEKLVEKLFVGKSKEDISVAIQGFGNVGYWFALHAHKLGYKVVAISDSKGGIYNEKGITPTEVAEYKQKHHVLPSEGFKKITNDELLRTQG
jgi:glutamate dehydrogenase/leucine dehydrogenase